MSRYFGIPLRNGLPLGLGSVASLRSGASALRNEATDWNFAALGLAGTPWADVSRTGLGTRVDSAGLVGFGPHNLLTRSEDFGNAAWSKNTATVTSGIADPLGGANAQTITATAAFASVLQSVSAVVGTPYVPSVYIRRRTGTGQIAFWNAAGTIVDVTASVTSNWTRIDIPAIAATSTAVFLYVRLAVSGDAVDVFGGQLNQGPLTAYVPTTTTARYLPRITHDPVTLSALGLLVEGQATNLLGMTEAFDDAYWSKSPGTTVTPNAKAGATGGIIADLVACASGGDYIRRALSIPATAARYTLSFYAEAAASPSLTVTEAGVTASSVSYDLSAGIITGVTNIGGSVSGTIQKLANGICRLTFSYTSNGSQTTLFLNIRPTSAYLSCAQLETGSVGTSYIPNPGTGSAVRVADDWFLSGAAFTDFWNPVQGTVIHEWIDYGSNVASDLCIARSNANISESIGIYRNAGVSEVLFWSRSGGVNQAIFPHPSPINVGQRNKAAFSWGPAGFALSVNGGAPVTGTGLVPNPQRITFCGAGISGSQSWQTVVACRSLRTQVTGAALQALTA